MSEEKQYLSVTLRLPEIEGLSDALAERGEVMCEALSKSKYSDNFKNNDIIVDYDDAPGELYISVSLDFMARVDISDFYGIIFGGIAGMDCDELL